MERMPTGWVCRSRTDGEAPEEPPIVLHYDFVPGDVVLKDVAKLIGASPAGATVRVVTRLDSVRVALRQWCGRNGVVIAHEDEFRVSAGESLSAEYTLDLRRA
jgi:hypothetical protein